MKPLYIVLEDAFNPSSVERTARRIATVLAVLCVAAQAIYWFVQRASQLTYQCGYSTGCFVHALNHACTQLVVHCNPAPARVMVQPVLHGSQLCLQDCMGGLQLVHQWLNDQSAWEQWKQILLLQLQYLHKALVPTFQFA